MEYVSIYLNELFFLLSPTFRIFFIFLFAYIWAITGVYGGNIISKIAGNLAVPIILGILLVSIIITIILNRKK